VTQPSSPSPRPRSPRFIGCSGAVLNPDAGLDGRSSRARAAFKSAPQAGASGPVPDVLGPDLRVVFCGINPGRVSAAAGAHFANPRNDFWRLLYAAGFTSRLYKPHEQHDVLAEGIGLTNAAYRTTAGSGDLRRGDFAGSADRLERIARELRPRWLAPSAKRHIAAPSASAPSSGRSNGGWARRSCSCCRPLRRPTLPFPGRSACAGSASSLASAAPAPRHRLRCRRQPTTNRASG
jgi:hypothetical protein